MNKILKKLFLIILVLALTGCGVKADVAKPNSSNNEGTTGSQQEQTKEEIKEEIKDEIKDETKDERKEETTEVVHLFEAKDMDVIELTGQEILDGKKADMSVSISGSINMEFHISRDNPNGCQLLGIYNENAINFAANYLNANVFDNSGEAIPSYTYQISCYDFDKDGMKEVIIACGNKQDVLSINIFEPYIEDSSLFSPINYILGYSTAYVNENNEICVPSASEVKTYQYNIQADDPEYAKLSGNIKISVDFATEEQLKNYENANLLLLAEDGASLLVLPKEKITDFSISYIQYDATLEKFQEVETLYSIEELSPEKPLIIKMNMPDLPTIKASYTSSSGMQQSVVIAESGKDGSIFLIEQGK